MPNELEGTGAGHSLPPIDPRNPERTDGLDDAWTEAGSDELLDFDVLVRIRQEAELVELARARRIERRGE